MGMFKLITNNFFKKAPTRLYPLVEEREAFERSRGRIEMDPSNCILCSICAKKCPADAITVDRATGKWELNALRCIICGECAASCPKKTIKMTNARRHSMADKEIVTHHVEPPKPAAKPNPQAVAAAAAAKAAKAAAPNANTDAGKVSPINPAKTEK